MLLDTNILIAYLDDETAVSDTLEAWRVRGVQLIISSITVAELLSYTRLSAPEIHIIQLLTGTFTSVPFDDEHAVVAAEIRRKYRFEIPDSGIIATAMIRRVPIVTRDKRMHSVAEVTFVNI